MNDLIRYQKLDNGIYEFVTMADNRAMVDAFFAAMSEIVATDPNAKSWLCLIDMSKNDMPPFAHFIEKNKAFVAAHPDIAQTKLALLLPGNNPFRSLIFSLTPVIMRMARSPLNVAIFEPKDRENAQFWLLTND